MIKDFLTECTQLDQGVVDGGEIVVIIVFCRFRWTADFRFGVEFRFVVVQKSNGVSYGFSSFLKDCEPTVAEELLDELEQTLSESEHEADISVYLFNQTA